MDILFVAGCLKEGRNPAHWLIGSWSHWLLGLIICPKRAGVFPSTGSHYIHGINVRHIITYNLKLYVFCVHSYARLKIDVQAWNVWKPGHDWIDCTRVLLCNLYQRWNILHSDWWTPDFGSIKRRTVHDTGSIGKESSCNWWVVHRLKPMCGSYFLGFVKVSFCFALLVDHHQTTIWENMCYSFQAVFANLSFFGFTSFCLPPLCAIDITKVRSYIYIYNLFSFCYI